MNLFTGLDGRPHEAEMKRRESPLCVAYGGGWDSTAMTIEMIRRGIHPDAIVFADTGGEKPETYDYLWSHFAPWCESRGLTLTVLPKTTARSEASLEDQCLRMKDLPSRAYGFGSCAVDWKLRPQWRFLERWPLAIESRARGVLPVRAVGFPIEEEHRATVDVDDEHELRCWYPLIEWGIDKSAEPEIILGAGLPLPPKSACYFCPSMKKHEILDLAQKHPDLIERALAMEAHAERNEKVKGLGRTWSWSEFLAADEEKRARLSDAVEGCAVCIS